MTVKVFRSTDFGAPANTNAAGSLIAILDACLVNGYGSQTVTSITRTGAVATVTLPAAHLLKGGTFVRISGATQTDYNGDFPITVTGANTFTYTVVNSPATPATGTITSKVAPVDWTKPFTGTNVAAFKQGAGSNGMYLRINDTVTTHPRVIGYENMTDINTGIAGFPTEAQLAGGSYFDKAESGTAQPWAIIADGKFFIIVIQANSTATVNSNAFGDFKSYRIADAYNTVLLSGTVETSGDGNQVSKLNVLGTPVAQVAIARSATQVGGCVLGGKISPLAVQVYVGSSGFAYPSTINGALHITPLTIFEGTISTGGFRGECYGIYNILHTRPLQDGDTFSGTGQYTGKRFLVFSLYNNAQMAVEISNTWS